MFYLTVSVLDFIWLLVFELFLLFYQIVNVLKNKISIFCLAFLLFFFFFLIWRVSKYFYPLTASEICLEVGLN